MHMHVGVSRADSYVRVCVLGDSAPLDKAKERRKKKKQASRRNKGRRIY